MYYTYPGLAWDAALKLTRVELEFLRDPDMLLMFDRGIRGGVSMMSTWYGKANNPFMGEEYEPSLPTKYIPYLDENNFYGWAMSKLSGQRKSETKTYSRAVTWNQFLRVSGEEG